MVENFPVNNFDDFKEKLQELEKLGYIWADSKTKPMKSIQHFMVFRENTVLKINTKHKLITFTCKEFLDN